MGEVVPLFVFGKAYPIEMLPDDRDDLDPFSSKPASELWAIRDVLLWNNCQGWWIENVSDYHRSSEPHGHSACRWMPLPPDPMTDYEAQKWFADYDAEDE